MKFFRLLLITVLSTLFTHAVCALGLGELTVESGLNEPLRARIPLLKVKDLGENELVAQLAPAADFDKQKISRDFLYTSINFRVDMKHPAGPSVLLTTDRAIKEPSMNFLVELSWPNGKLVRSYTVLLDNPAAEKR
jgi:pilus assembly protein FimV